MDTNFDAFEAVAKIMVIGCGGGGSNAVNQMYDEQLQGVSFVVCNTDMQALNNSTIENRIILGKDVTGGLGAGGNPELGRRAAEASIDELTQLIQGCNMVFIAAGMGGGTGSGAAPVIAKIAKECGALTIAVVTRPFDFEGERRKRNAVTAIEELNKYVDSIIIISNDKLMLKNSELPLKEAFLEGDKVLAQAVRTITDVIVVPGQINLDFADVKATLENKGIAVIGYGEGEGENKAIDAATNALLSPLLESSVDGARALIVNITCGQEVTMGEVKKCINYITSATGQNANIIFGIQNNSVLGNKILLSVIATDFEEKSEAEEVLSNIANNPAVPSDEAVVEEEAEEETEAVNPIRSFFEDIK